MDAAYFRMLFDYNYAVHDKVWDCATHLTDEQFTRDLGYSHDSVRNQFVHVMGGEARWLARIQGAPLPDYPSYDEYPTLQAARAQWEEGRARMLAYIDALDDAELQRVVAYDIPSRGGPKQSKVYEILAHLVNHGTDHRAQILAMLHRLGAPTVEQDLMIYLWNR